MSHPRLIVRGIPALCLFLSALPLSGCWFSHGGSRDRTAGVDLQSLEPIVWPQRDMEIVRNLAEATPDQVYALEIVDSELASDETKAQADAPVYTVHRVGLTDRGVLRVFDRVADDASDPLGSFAGLFSLGPDTNAWFLSSRDAEPIQSRDGIRNYYAVPEGAAFTHAGRLLQLEEGVAIALPEIDDPASVRGIVLYFNGLISTKYEEAFASRIDESDWVTIRIDTVTGVRTTRDALREQRSDERSRWIQRRMELVASESPDPASARKSMSEEIENTRKELDEALPQYRRGFTLSDPSQAESVGRQIAEAVDDTFAENAYAAEAALDALLLMHPKLSEVPVAVVGCSAGSIAAPAVAARLADRIDALVLVGGGADLLRIDQETSLERSRRLGVFVAENEEVTAEEWGLVHEAYLQAVQLDPITLGPRLRHIPTLIIRAGFDKWVPASTGSELVRAFGKPDRDWHPGGHQTLFYFLEGRAPRVLRWLDKNTPEPVRETEQAATVAP